MSRSATSVIIVGAGPVGLSLALGLAKQGVASIVLEARKDAAARPKAGGILPRTLEILSGWGVAQAFLEAGSFRQTLQLRWAHKARSFYTIDLSALKNDTDFPGILLLPQYRTEAILEEAACRTDYAQIRRGHRVVGVHEGDNLVRADVQTAHGEYYSLYGSYLVGCDGMGSMVRRGLGLELEGKTYPTRMWLADVQTKEGPPASEGLRLARLDGSTIFALPLAPGLWRLLAVAKDGGALGHNALSLVHRRAKAALGVDSATCVWQDVFDLHCRMSPRMRHHRILLAGDAAHVNSPAGGQGMNGGVQDAHNLAWKLAQALRRTGNAAALLKSYESERKEAFSAYAKATSDRLTRYVVMAPWWLRVCVTTAMRFALLFRPMQRRLFRRLGMLDMRYTQSAMLVGHHPLLGRRAPQIELQNKAGERHKVFDHARPQGTLLYFDDAGDAHSDAVLRAATVCLKEIRTLRICGDTLPPHATHTMLLDPKGAAWRLWQAHRGMVAFVRPDGIVGWVAYQAPATVSQSLSALRRALGMRQKSVKAEQPARTRRASKRPMQAEHTSREPKHPTT